MGMKLPKIPPTYFRSLTKSEQANYVFDIVLFGFIFATGRYVSTAIQGYAYLMGLAFFLSCFIYAQLKPR